MAVVTSSESFLVQRLRTLCARFGDRGHVHVAKKAGINPQSLKQILTGVELKSGNRKSVGPSISARITRAFPDWLEQSSHDAVEPVVWSAAEAPPAFYGDDEDVLRRLGMLLRRLPPGKQRAAADVLSEWALDPEASERWVRVMIALLS